ncbi:MAG: hypothetical protein MUF87_07225 [Anaerolineae bacterium]|jgi:hypothetical protein|nr:hypothetical protein [Anaerolineae bacterium]
MSSYENNLWAIYKHQEGLMSTRAYARVKFAETGDNAHLEVIKYVEENLKNLQAQKAKLDAENLQQLIQLCTQEDYPLSIRTWLEDEYKDLIG